MGGRAGDRHRGARLIGRSIRRLALDDRARLAELLRASWGSTRMASRGRLLDIAELPGFIAEDDGQWLGYAAYQLDDRSLEVAVLESVVPGAGAARALLAGCVAEALASQAQRVWLITTNDNTVALRFYQRLGLRLVALHRGAVDEARRTLKREIPEVGLDGIPIRDEIELELAPPDWPLFVERHAWPPS